MTSVLEIGAGRGAMGARLARRFSYVGIEPDPAAFDVARRRIAPRGEVLNCSAEELDRGGFDLVCVFEVLEHLEDDVGSLARWREQLRPAGWLLLSVPAGAHRFGRSDLRVGHWRRYDPDDLTAALVGAGFTQVAVERVGFPLGYVLHFLWAIAARLSPGAASAEERTAGSGRWLQPSDLAATLTWVLARPFRLFQRPFARSSLGTGLVVLARADGSS